MAADQIIATDTDRTIARNGILMHLQATDIAKDYNSFSEAIEALNMWAFIENEVEVKAHAMADSRRLNNIIREMTHEFVNV